MAYERTIAWLSSHLHWLPPANWYHSLFYIFLKISKTWIFSSVNRPIFLFWIASILFPSWNKSWNCSWNVMFDSFISEKYLLGMQLWLLTHCQANVTNISDNFADWKKNCVAWKVGLVFFPSIVISIHCI